jgi:predicted phage terminase large subunit-like protein
MEAHDGRHYLADQRRGKWEILEMTAQINRAALEWNADVLLIEDKGQGTAYIQSQGETNYQRRQAPAPIVPINPGVQGKAFRLDAVAPIIHDHKVFIPKNAPWLDIFLTEIGQFPDGAHDDVVDSLSQYLNYARSVNTRFGTRKIKSKG